MNKETLQSLVPKGQIIIKDFYEHGKASECYVAVQFIQADGFTWDTFVTYINRRAGLFLKTEVEVASYLKSITCYFTKEAMNAWKAHEKKIWKKSKAYVTKDFFNALLTFEPVTVFPPNDNPARRIQDIKDAGYTIATIHHYQGKKSARILLPIPKSAKMEYETFTPQFKARVIRLLQGVNAYEDKTTIAKGLIPDHKFSEVRWDENTKGENPMNMSDEEIISKFQLLDNQRNQQKREVCRRCFQEGKRGIIYGIPYFYAGNENWDTTIPPIGKCAEKGCIGCAWYDIQEWRKRLIEKLNGK